MAPFEFKAALAVVRFAIAVWMAAAAVLKLMLPLYKPANAAASVAFAATIVLLGPEVYVEGPETIAERACVLVVMLLWMDVIQELNAPGAPTEISAWSSVAAWSKAISFVPALSIMAWLSFIIDSKVVAAIVKYFFMGAFLSLIFIYKVYIKDRLNSLIKLINSNIKAVIIIID